MQKSMLAALPGPAHLRGFSESNTASVFLSGTLSPEFPCFHPAVAGGRKPRLMRAQHFHSTSQRFSTLNGCIQRTKLSHRYLSPSPGQCNQAGRCLALESELEELSLSLAGVGAGMWPGWLLLPVPHAAAARSYTSLLCSALEAGLQLKARLAQSRTKRLGAFMK